jgi:hypothetical protein
MSAYMIAGLSILGAVLAMIFVTWRVERHAGWRRRVEGWSDFCFRDSHEPVGSNVLELLAPPTPREQLYIAQRDEWERLARIYHAALFDIAGGKAMPKLRALDILKEYPLPIAPGEKL